jgi:hypothetical protein
MLKISRNLILFLTLCLVLLLNQMQPVAAKSIKTQSSGGEITCFSGGREILRKELVAGPFADEYKFAHEVTVRDERGEHSLNFAGGLCIIDRGAVSTKSKLALSDRLSCYSGANPVVNFEVYGRETTVDEYVEGRTFLAKANGNAFNSNSLHEYLVFGGGTCLGEEIN